MATDQQMERAGPPLAELPAFARSLIRAGVVNEEVLREALAEKPSQTSIVRALVEQERVDEGALCRFLGAHYGVECLDLAGVTIDPILLELVPSKAARRLLAVPVREEDGLLIVAMADPTDIVAKDDLKALLRRDFQTVAAPYSQVLAVIERSQLNLKEQIDRSSEVGSAEGALATPVEEVVEEGPIIQLVRQTITQAILDRASDIHIEPINGAIRIRFRIDGVLHEVARVKPAAHQRLLSRIKVLAGLDISERRKPQDGRFSIGVEGKKADLRVATLPTYLGEKVVIRVLDTGTARLDLPQLGFLPEMQATYEQITSKPWGTILVTGPTGSGKSTTLYATLNRLNREETNVITVEDPVEYQLSGINQIQVNPAAGLTFAAALRSILRADPDIILVGEVRDRETAVIAIEAALTGHLVLTSLHTNDALSTPTRLYEMGVEPYLVASALSAVVGQRLARRLCVSCREQTTVTRSQLRALGFAPPADEEVFTVYGAHPEGCPRCSKTGYYGRIALHELLVVSEAIGRGIAERASAAQLGAIAREEGFLPLRQVGLAQVLQGITSIEELLRVLV
jgi:type IV pilus assembly protein PilB